MGKHSLVLCKVSQRSLNADIMNKQLDYAVGRALAGQRGRVWKARKHPIGIENQNGDHLYSASIDFKFSGRSGDPARERQRFERVKELAQKAVRSRGWTLQENLQSATPDTNGSPKPANRAYADVKINIDPSAGYFSHLYNLDSQIELVVSAVEEYSRSEFTNRFHCVLYGEAACGKTEILRSLTRMLGSDAVMHFDATSTTSAGAKQLLTETASIPPVLCIEEIEKADETSLRWLLGVLDYRAEVRALKFRSGLVSREVKLLCLATVNDYGLFGRMMDGALASRFSHKIYFPRPSRTTLEKILHREIERCGGLVDWIAPALDYCLDQEKTNDPRRIITVCLCGRDKLLSGEYQKTLAATQAPKG